MEEKIIYDFQLNNIEETLRLIGNQSDLLKIAKITSLILM